ncbi:MAG TPA: DUF3857 domain-containing protein [Chitinophagaceae bacterium]|nr:DUF3857 domain-containing protein [Chitinophagaceae bacterium]
MKRIPVILILCIACSSVFAQQHITKGQLEFLNKDNKNEKLLADDDADFKNNTAPAKWNDESAVILSQKTSFDFDRKGVSTGKRIGRNIWGIVFALPTLGTSLLLANANNTTAMLIEERERRRLLLKDKFAVDQYSVLYFRLAAEGDAFQARIIKANGTVQPVDLSEALTVENIQSVPGLFRSYTDHRFSASYRPDYFKIAMPDLEEGDIIEYEYVNMNQKTFTHNPAYVEFDPIYYLCNRSLPVMHQVIEVVSEDRRYHVGYKSLEGAPDFTETTSKGNKVYRWEDNDRDKITDTRFLDEYLEMPSVKFQMVYTRNSDDELVWYKNLDDTKKDLSPEDLTNKIKAFWFNGSKLLDESNYAPPGGDAGSTEHSIYKLMKKRGLTDLTDDDYINKAYYTIRSYTLYHGWSDYAFAKIFAKLLDEKHIPVEIVVTAYNDRTKLDKIAFADELVWIVKYKDHYYCNPGEHLNPGEIPDNLNGNTAVRFSAGAENSKTSSDIVPQSDTLENKLTEQISASLDIATGNMSIVKDVEARGLMKEDLIDDILALTPFMQNDYTNYGGTDMWEGLSDAGQEKAMTEFNQQKKEWKDEKPKLMQARAENEYGHRIETYTDFKLLQDGRSIKKKLLKYNESFTIGDMTSAAGDDIVLSLSLLTGGQTKIKKEERTRTYPIDIGFPREFLWTISMPIPAGYTVVGLDGLKKNVVNECGSFMSTADVKDNNIVISVKKVYKQSKFDASKWPLMLEMLDAGYRFTQSKLILKKL